MMGGRQAPWISSPMQLATLQHGQDMRERAALTLQSRHLSACFSRKGMGEELIEGD